MMLDFVDRIEVLRIIEYLALLYRFETPNDKDATISACFYFGWIFVFGFQGCDSR